MLRAFAYEARRQAHTWVIFLPERINMSLIQRLELDKSILGDILQNWLGSQR